MAEAIAVIGLVASIVQLVDFSSKVLHRLEEFQASLGEIPRSFQHIKVELPVLQDTLQQTREAIEAGSVRNETKKALVPAIEGCAEQIGLLDHILAKALPVSTDSRLIKGKKAILSLQQEAKTEKITKTLRSYVGTLTFYYASISSRLQPLTDAKLTQIRRWLSPPNPSYNYQKALKRRQVGTGSWFLESNEYAAWKIDPASFLWLHGIPGCGKTILSSTILENVFQYCADDPGRVVAYFYFDFNDTEKHSSELMVRSLICQLSQQCVKIPTSLEHLFSSCDNGQQHPPLDSLLEVLHHTIQEFPQSYIILDALDECTDRAELTAILERMAGWKLDESHLLVTSRKVHDIQRSLESIVDTQNTVCLQSELVDRDILTYVRQTLSNDMSLSKWQKDPNIRDEIETALTKGPHGMFRWAACQIDTLRKCRNRMALRKALTTLPQTLGETYERILCAINEEDSEYAIRILRWLAFSCRPLLVEEIAEVVAINVERNPAFNREEVLEDPLEVLSICSSLVTINVTDGHSSTKRIVALAHYSVKEYLTTEPILQSRAARYGMQDVACNEFIAKGCVSYLLQFQGSGPFSYATIQDSKLALYVAKFWITHTQAQAAAPNTEDLNRMIMELVSTEHSAYLNWIRIHNLEMPWKETNFDRTLAEVPAPLYIASLSGLAEIVDLLLFKASADVNAQGGLNNTALQAASRRGHKRIVELLVNRGANVNAQGGRYGTALQGASRGGHKEIVELLLAKGASVNTQGGYYGTALQGALVEGHERIVELLVNRGADVNTQAGHYTALQGASVGGHESIVELLLNRGANVNAQGEHYYTALQGASVGGHERIVELLLNRGADVNAQGGPCGTALQGASVGGHERIVELLLNRGANVNAQGGHYCTALQGASVRGHESIVELLLNRGANVNAQGGYYGTALQGALVGGHERIVELLLNRDADVNAQGGYYGTALQGALTRGHIGIVELLLARGANVNAQGGHYYTALQGASVEGHEKIVELLLNRGADVNAQGGYYGTALQGASIRGYKRIVELLLNRGANINV